MKQSSRSQNKHLALMCIFFASSFFVQPLGFSQSADSRSAANSFQTPRPFDPQYNTTNPSALSAQSQNPYLGSVPTGPATGTDIALSLDEAIQLSLHNNLGLLDNHDASNTAKAVRLHALSELLPQLQLEASTIFQTENLTSIGSRQLSLPNRVGPFNWGYAQVSLSDDLLDIAAKQRLQARSREESMTKMNVADARNIVVLAAASAYMAVSADDARVQSLRASVEAAKSLNTLVAHRVEHQLSTDLDQIRTHVGERTAEQTLRLAVAQTAKDKLALGRVIGFPADQQFHLTDPLRFFPHATDSQEKLLETAATHRSDLAASKLRVEAEERKVKATNAERLPTLGLSAHYGGAGINPGSFYGNYDVGAKLQLPLFTGGRIKSDQQAANTELVRATHEWKDLEQRVKFDVQNTLIDLQSAEDGVQVATENQQLAQRAFKEEKDRFEAGLSQTVELVQARETVAEAENNYILNVYGDMLARLALIRATGTAERDVMSYVTTH